MNDKSNFNSVNPRKIWTRLFIGILSLQALLELAIGATLLINFPTAIESGFGITYSSELEILGIALGLYLLLLTTLMILSIVWTSKSNLSGTTLGIILGVFLLTFGVTAFLKLGDPQPLYIDSLRGLITIVTGYMARKELQLR